jgi:lipopolysaccharide transport system permease protein
MWKYFAECLTKTSTVFKDNANIFGKVYFPRFIMPLSIVASNLVKLGVQLLMLILLFVYYILFQDYHPNISAFAFFIPVFLLLMAALGLGAGMIISAMTTKYRDLSFLVTFGVQLFMYATPVIYPMSAAPLAYKHLIALNPMAPIIEGIRFALLGKGEFSMGSLGYTIVVTLFILLIGTLTFNKVEKSFVDTV